MRDFFRGWPKKKWFNSIMYYQFWRLYIFIIPMWIWTIGIISLLYSVTYYYFAFDNFTNSVLKGKNYRGNIAHLELEINVKFVTPCKLFSSPSFSSGEHVPVILRFTHSYFISTKLWFPFPDTLSSRQLNIFTDS